MQSASTRQDHEGVDEYRMRKSQARFLMAIYRPRSQMQPMPPTKGQVQWTQTLSKMRENEPVV